MSDDASRAKRAILIAGPTASGKSAVALALAERLDGVVINADSMQVYADLSILTARPSPADMARVPHRLFGHVDAAETYSVGRWLREVADVLETTWAEGRVPIVVGGTGLYLKALTEGLSDIPAVPDEVRARVRTWAQGQATKDLHTHLTAIDPEMAQRLRSSDPQRILRAIEVFEATGLSLLTFQANRGEPILDRSRRLAVTLAVDRSELILRIEHRFDAMMEAGALDEVLRLSTRRLDPALPAMRTLGVPPLLAHLNGECTIGEAIRRSKLQTLQYAKRQMTFARHQFDDFDFESANEAYNSTFRAFQDLS